MDNYAHKEGEDEDLTLLPSSQSGEEDGVAGGEVKANVNAKAPPVSISKDELPRHDTTTTKSHCTTRKYAVVAVLAVVLLLAGVAMTMRLAFPPGSAATAASTSSASASTAASTAATTPTAAAPSSPVSHPTVSAPTPTAIVVDNNNNSNLVPTSPTPAVIIAPSANTNNNNSSSSTTSGSTTPATNGTSATTTTTTNDDNEPELGVITATNTPYLHCSSSTSTTTTHHLVLLHGASFTKEIWTKLNIMSQFCAVQGVAVTALDMSYGTHEQLRSILTELDDKYNNNNKNDDVPQVVLITPSAGGTSVVGWLIDGNVNELHQAVQVWVPVAVGSLSTASDDQVSSLVSTTSSLSILAIYGDRDTSGGRISQRLAQLAGAVVVELPGGHPVYRDSPEAFVTTILTFLGLSS